MVGLNDDQIERKADGDSDFIDDEVEGETNAQEAGCRRIRGGPAR